MHFTALGEGGRERRREREGGYREGGRERRKERDRDEEKEKGKAGGRKRSN